MGDVSAMDIMSKALTVVMTASAPPLICGLVVGIIASIFQTITSIQEATLAFVPKILAVMIALVVFGSFIGTVLQDFAIEVFRNIPNLLG